MLKGRVLRNTPGILAAVLGTARINLKPHRRGAFEAERAFVSFDRMLGFVAIVELAF